MIKLVNPLETGPSDELLALDARQALTLYRVGKMVNASLDLAATLDAVTLTTHQLTDAHTTALALLDWDGNLVIRAGQGDVVASVGERIRADEGITGQAMRERRTILVGDMRQEPGRARPELDDRYHVRTFLAVPLIWHDEPLGVVTVAFATPNALDTTDVALVSALAELAATAVSHARDYAEEQRLRAESEEINRQFAEQTAQLERAQQQLVQNEKLTAIGQLVQGLAHEINTPLSVVITNLAVLARHAENLGGVAHAAQQALSTLPAGAGSALEAAIQDADLEYTLEDLPDLLSESTTAAKRVSELVRSMSTFARRDAGGPLQLQIQDVLEGALNLASNPLKQRAKTMREFSATPPVVGLASELTELFVHLLINAAQALEDQPGTVTVSTAYESGHVVVRVRDTGRGIAEENLARVFDPFFTTRAVGAGSGMGLAVCYGIATRHNGSITLDSKLGPGTTVTVRLPAATAQQIAA
jgi:two-component system, NtrC family, sensor kinase